MYNEQILAMIKILTDAKSGASDPKTAIEEALKAANSLRDEAVGEDNTKYTHVCKAEMGCGKENCSTIGPVKLADPTLCLGTGKPGCAKFELVSRDPYKT